MQRKIVMATAIVCAGPVLAQSSVMLSGVVDTAIRHVSNGGVGSSNGLVSGSNGTSRIMLSGKEDLGNGFGANFHLEHGLLADTGMPASSTKFWDRRSTVGLSSKTLGDVKLGRELVPTYVVWSRYDPFSYIGAARSANFVTSTPLGPVRSAFGSSNNTTVRADNSVQYTLPDGLGGFEGALMVTPREGGDVATGAAKLVSARVGYVAGGFNIAMAHSTVENSLTTAAGKFKDSVVGGSFTWSGLTLSLAWRDFKVNSSKQALTMLAANWRTGPHEVKASFIKSNMSGSVGNTSIAGNDAKQIGLGYVYSMSKRTALYATVAQISNNGAAAYVISDGPTGMSGGRSSRGYEFGLRHRF